MYNDWILVQTDLGKKEKLFKAYEMLLYHFKDSVTVRYIFVYCRLLSLFAKIYKVKIYKTTY